MSERNEGAAQSERRRPGVFLVALLIDLIGAGGALLISLRTWQTIRTPQPTRTDVLDVSGRTVDAASTALGLVALAGVVALLATRGAVRRAIGAVLALAGLGLIWRAIMSGSAVGAGRARSLVESAHRTVSATGVTPHVTAHHLWPVLSAVAGALVLLSGALIAWRGHRGQVMSARYEPPSATGDVADQSSPEEIARAQSKAATALWSALDRGEDPTL